MNAVNSTMATVRAAQYGTKHSHAAGKIRAMIANPSVELAGVYEPDPVARAALASQEPYSELHLFATKEDLLDESIVLVASEGANDESLEQTRELVAAGKHVW